MQVRGGGLSYSRSVQAAQSRLSINIVSKKKKRYILYLKNTDTSISLYLQRACMHKETLRLTDSYSATLGDGEARVAASCMLRLRVAQDEYPGIA